jgi:hypothetical protein
MDKNTIFAITLLLVVIVISGLFPFVYAGRTSTLLDQFTTSIRTLFHKQLPETRSMRLLPIRKNFHTN